MGYLLKGKWEMIRSFFILTYKENVVDIYRLTTYNYIGSLYIDRLYKRKEREKNGD